MFVPGCKVSGGGEGVDFRGGFRCTGVTRPIGLRARLTQSIGHGSTTPAQGISAIGIGSTRVPGPLPLDLLLCSQTSSLHHFRKKELNCSQISWLPLDAKNDHTRTELSQAVPTPTSTVLYI